MISKRRRILTQEDRPRSKTVQVDGEKLVELRTRKNWTQEKLADKAIVSVRTVQNIERGRPTQRSTLARLAGALGVSARDLMVVMAPEPTTPDPGLWALTEADAKFTTAGGGGDHPQGTIGAGPDFDRVVASLVSKLAQNKTLQISDPSRAAIVRATIALSSRDLATGNDCHSNPRTQAYGGRTWYLMSASWSSWDAGIAKTSRG